MSDQTDTQLLSLEESGPAEEFSSSPLPDTPAEAVSPSETVTEAASRRKRLPAVSLEALQPGMELTGIVRNIQPFGAFVDIGAETDGLVHISELRDDFVEKVEDVVQVGDVVTVRVKEVDAEREHRQLRRLCGHWRSHGRPRPHLRVERYPREPGGRRSRSGTGSQGACPKRGPNPQAHQPDYAE